LALVIYKYVDRIRDAHAELLLSLSYLVKKKHPGSAKKFSETNIKMLKFVLLTTYLLCLVDLFSTICAPLLADLFLYSYKTDFIQGLLKKNEKKLARSFYFTFRYTDDVPSLNNSKFGDFVDRIFPIELEIKDTTDTARSASYLDLHLEIDSECRLRTKLNDKRDYFNFPIVNIPFICSNIPAAPAYGLYMSI